MAKQERRMRLPGEISQVRAACDFVVEVAQEAGLGDDGVFQCQLSVEEIFTNIVEHGYAHSGSDKTIELVCEYSETTLIISIIDEAPPFNPLELGEPDPDTPLWERDDGGWGVYFVRQYMDDVRYKLDNKKNRLILEKKIS
jgi:anti-sigma regulatory factor (Ser/Thr protein kinase)